LLGNLLEAFPRFEFTLCACAGAAPLKPLDELLTQIRFHASPRPRGRGPVEANPRWGLALGKGFAVCWVIASRQFISPEIFGRGPGSSSWDGQQNDKSNYHASGKREFVLTLKREFLLT